MTNSTIPILRLENIKKHFPVNSQIFSKRRIFIRAVDNVSFNILKGDTFALVGESGCGKTTIGKMILRLIDITDGKIYFKSKNLIDYRGLDSKELRSKIQIIFQDPYSSLNPRKTIGKIIE